MLRVHAIYEGGVFRPLEAIDLPERTPVEFELQFPNAAASPGVARIYEILGRKHTSGHTDTAERHNEHQP